MKKLDFLISQIDLGGAGKLKSTVLASLVRAFLAHAGTEEATLAKQDRENVPSQVSLPLPPKPLGSS